MEKTLKEEFLSEMATLKPIGGFIKNLVKLPSKGIESIKSYVRDFEFDEGEGATHISTWSRSELIVVMSLCAFIVLVPLALAVL